MNEYSHYQPTLAVFGQGGRGGAGAFAQKHVLAGQTLEMLADMRRQFAGMLADARFVAPAPRAGGRSGRRGDPGGGAAWADDPAAPWNKHAAQPAVVRSSGPAGSALAGRRARPVAVRQPLHCCPGVLCPSPFRRGAPAWRRGALNGRPVRIMERCAGCGNSPARQRPAGLQESCAATSTERGASAARVRLNSPVPPFVLVSGWIDARAPYTLSLAAQVKAVLCAALYPNAAVMEDMGAGAGRPAWNDGAADVHIHPSSVLHGLEAGQFARPYLIYLEKAR